MGIVLVEVVIVDLVDQRKGSSTAFGRWLERNLIDTETQLLRQIQKAKHMLATRITIPLANHRNVLQLMQNLESL